jgi:hypothetical protein
MVSHSYIQKLLLPWSMGAWLMLELVAKLSVDHMMLDLQVHAEGKSYVVMKASTHISKENLRG